jgi:hypothetical protein
MKREVESPATYRAEDRFLFIAVPLLLPPFIAAWLLHHFNVHPTGFFAVVCAFLFTLPFFAGIAIFAIYLGEEKDEFKRMLISRALMWGTGVTLTVTTFWSTMENLGVGPVFRVRYVVGLFMVPYLVALFVLRRRYR